MISAPGNFTAIQASDNAARISPGLGIGITAAGHRDLHIVHTALHAGGTVIQIAYHTSGVELQSRIAAVIANIAVHRNRSVHVAVFDGCLGSITCQRTGINGVLITQGAGNLDLDAFQRHIFNCAADDIPEQAYIRIGCCSRLSEGLLKFGDCVAIAVKCTFEASNRCPTGSGVIECTVCFKIATHKGNIINHFKAFVWVTANIAQMRGVRD